MRAWALAVMLAVAGCGAEKTPNNVYPDFSPLYDVAADPVCKSPGTVSADATAMACEWTCLHVDGKNVSWVQVDFERPTDASPWALKRITFSEGACQ